MVASNLLLLSQFPPQYFSKIRNDYLSLPSLYFCSLIHAFGSNTFGKLDPLPRLDLSTASALFYTGP
jgi:hypothetical protein